MPLTYYVEDGSGFCKVFDTVEKIYDYQIKAYTRISDAACQRKLAVGILILDAAIKMIRKMHKSSAERVLNKDWSKCDPVAKLQFGLYVIYRFRNNIFHGNKTIFEWLNNREQIEDCVIVLLRLTEFYDKIKNEARAST